MFTAQEYEEALAFFTQPNHLASYEILEGRGKVMLSAPHAVLQTRHGALKQAERYTGALCRLLHAREGWPCIYKARHLGDDANHDAQSPYRDALCDYIREKGVACVLDLHQLAPERPMDLCLCTGRGQNLAGWGELPLLLRDCFARHGFGPITLDDPFDAKSAHTVSATVARRCGIPSVQVELNSRLCLEDPPGERFFSLAEALREAVLTLNAQLTQGGEADAAGTHGGERLSENQQI